MKRHTFIYIAAVLALFTIHCSLFTTAAHAQETQDALYIYRNDGKFHGFFYSDIVRIAYSNIDTLGIEHDDIVVQEIYALDSVFRIPITAIDSVAFVTPETKYRPDVVTPKSNLWDYVIASDSMSTFTLSASTPQSLIPKKGDKLANASATPYLPYGMLGQVASVTNNGSGIVVKCERIDLTELFDRFVGKYAGRIETPNAARRRAPVRRANDIDQSYKAKENTIPLKPLHINLDFNNGTLTGGIGIKLGNNYSFTGDGHLLLSVEPSLIMRTFLEVSREDGTFLDMTTRLEVETDYDLEAKASATASTDCELLKIPFPLLWGMGGLYEFGGTMGITGEFAVKQNWHNKTSAYGYIQWIKGYKNDATGSIHVLDDNWNSGMTGTMAVNFGFYHTIKVYPWTDKLTNIETRFETGIKGELKTGLDLMDIAILSKPELAIFDTRSFYEKMDRDLAYKVSLYGNGKIVWNFANEWITKDIYTIYDNDKSLGSEFGVVPKITNVRWELDEKRNWRGNVITYLDRKIITPMEVGQALFNRDKDEFFSSWTYDEKYGSPSDFTKYTYGYEYLQPNRNYRVYPTVGFKRPFSLVMLANNYVDFTLGPPSITFKPGSKVEVPETSGSKQFEVHTNMYNTEMVDPKGADWLMTSYIKDDGDLKIYYQELPENVDMRRASIHFIGRDSLNKEILKEDSLVVTQIRPAIHADPTFLEFDAKGGTKTVKLTTPLNQLWAELGDDKVKYLTFKLDTLKMTLDVTVEESKEKNERSTALLIHGYSPNGQRGNLQLNIFQAGIGGDDPDPGPGPQPGVIDADTLYFNGEGGTVDIVLHLNKIFYPDEYYFYFYDDAYSAGGLRPTISLKDNSDPLNPIYTFTMPQTFTNITLHLSLGYIYRYNDKFTECKKLVVVQRAYSEKPLNIGRCVIGINIEDDYDTSYTLAAPEFEWAQTNHPPKYSFTSIGGKTYIKIEHERKWTNSVNMENKTRVNPHEDKEGDPKLRETLELVVAQHEDDIYFESATYTYYRHSYDTNDLKSVKDYLDTGVYTIDTSVLQDKKMKVKSGNNLEIDITEGLKGGMKSYSWNSKTKQEDCEETPFTRFKVKLRGCTRSDN